MNMNVVGRGLPRVLVLDVGQQTILLLEDTVAVGTGKLDRAALVNGGGTLQVEKRNRDHNVIVVVVVVGGGGGGGGDVT